MKLLVNAWYNDAPWLKLLRPLSVFYGFVSQRRRRLYLNGSKKTYQSHLPIIVVGNISVGGTGKTPLIIALCHHLQAAGFKPGIVSRGYQSKAKVYPYTVNANSSPVDAGDEALLITINTACPVVIAPKRVIAVKVLENEFDCDVILSDDGLQHYAMGRSIEIAVVDGARGFGNGRLLPEGPLRELPARLESVDFLINNGRVSDTLPVLPSTSYTMNLKPSYLCNLKTGEKRSIESLIAQNSEPNRQKVHALAGIGNPARFFNSLCSCDFDIITHVFKDHHAFSPSDINFDDEFDVVMTEKDAIKCMSFASEKHWYLKVDVEFEGDFMSIFINKVNNFNKLKSTLKVK